MKIKSVTDVVTNSSSEVFIAKTEDIKECFKELYGDDILPSKHSYSAETVEQVVEDFNKGKYKTIENFLREDLGITNAWILYQYNLSGETKEVLKAFGHTDEEIEEFIRKREEQKNSLRSDKVKGILGKTILEYWDHSWMDADIINWFKKHNKEYKHEID